MNDSVYRILDANINRCIEGLRVIEEYFRFIDIDKSIQRKLKDMRHNLAETANSFDFEKLLSNRNSNDDIGAVYSTESELKKETTLQILKTNFKRCQEALRVLEEYSKIIDSAASVNFKKLRFNLYSLEKSVILKTK